MAWEGGMRNEEWGMGVGERGSGFSDRGILLRSGRENIRLELRMDPRSTPTREQALRGMTTGAG
jgi:hypothetical protein